jgi:hypothetical protein
MTCVFPDWLLCYSCCGYRYSLVTNVVSEDLLLYNFFAGHFYARISFGKYSFARSMIEYYAIHEGTGALV